MTLLPLANNEMCVHWLTSHRAQPRQPTQYLNRVSRLSWEEKQHTPFLLLQVRTRTLTYHRMKAINYELMLPRS